MKIFKTMPDRLRVELAAALCLLTLTLIVFVVVNPFNSALDDWAVIFTTKPGVASTITRYAGRPFSFDGILLANLLFNGQVQGIFIVHVVSIFLTAFCLFHLVTRLIPNQTAFAFLVASLYLFYLPINVSQIMAVQFEIYSWACMVAVVAMTLFTEQALIKGWSAALILAFACVFGYVAVLSYESTFPLLLLAPVILFIVQRKFSRHFVASALIWYVGISIAFLQFVIPYLHGDSTQVYQETYFKPVRSVSAFLSNTLAFSYLNFPVSSLIKDFGDFFASPYLTTAIVLGLIGLVVWRIFSIIAHTTYPVLSLRELLLILIVGFVAIAAGGIVYIYANFLVPRSVTFSAIGEAVVLSAAICLLDVIIQRFFAVRPGLIIVGALSVLFCVGCYWYYHDNANAPEPYDFTQQAVFFREFVSLIPDVKSPTLIYYQCDTSDTKVSTRYQSETGDVYGIRYLYDDRANFRKTNELSFNAQDITVASSYGDLLGPILPKRYGYDQLVVVACTPDGLTIVDPLPAALAQGENAYNPYQRIVYDYINPSQARILAP